MNRRLAVHVVDDDASVRDSLCLLLRLHGYVPRPAASGEAFLDALEEGAPTAVVVEEPWSFGPVQHEAQESDDAWRLFPTDGRLKFFGWANGGAPINFSDPVSGFIGPFNAQF